MLVGAVAFLMVGGMLLSDSFKPDLSHTSILYYCDILELYDIWMMERGRQLRQNAWGLYIDNTQDFIGLYRQYKRPEE